MFLKYPDSSSTWHTGDPSHHRSSLRPPRPGARTRRCCPHVHSSRHCRFHVPARSPFSPEVSTELLPDLVLCELRISSSAQEARCRHKNRPSPSGMDRTAFQNEGVGLVAVIAKLPTDFFRHKIVLLPAGVKSIHGSSQALNSQSIATEPHLPRSPQRSVPHPAPRHRRTPSGSHGSHCPGFPANISRAFSSTSGSASIKTSLALRDGPCHALECLSRFFAP